jgi:hypothetical protein
MNKDKTKLQSMDNFTVLTTDQEYDIQAGESIVEKVVNTVTDFIMDVFKH